MMLRRSQLLFAGVCCSLGLGVDGFSFARSNISRAHRRRLKQMAALTTSKPATATLPIQQWSTRKSLNSLASLSDPNSPNGVASHYRSRIRNVTGFSLTAARSFLRTMTGISATAIYTSAVALSGAWIRTIMALVLNIWPTWLRYFVQPFLVLYYAPLLILRNLAGPNRTNARRSHDHFVEGWKRAVQVADGSTQYWPVHVNSANELESDISELDMREAIAESSFLSMELQEQAGLQG